MHEANRPRPGPGVVFDRDDAIRRLGSESLFYKIALLFIANMPSMMCQIDQAIQESNARVLEHTAHSMGGAVAYLSAPCATELLMHLEKMGHDGDLAHAASVFARLQEEIDRLVSAVTDMLSEEEASRES